MIVVVGAGRNKVIRVFCDAKRNIDEIRFLTRFTTMESQTC